MDKGLIVFLFHEEEKTSGKVLFSFRRDFFKFDYEIVSIYGLNFAPQYPIITNHASTPIITSLSWDLIGCFGVEILQQHKIIKI